MSAFLHNTAIGRRCFVLGNGASLLRQEKTLRELNGQPTLTCNHFYEWHGAPLVSTYHGVTDIVERRVLRQCEGPKTALHIAGTRVPGIVYDPWIGVPISPDIGENRIMAAGFQGLGDTLPPLPTGQTTPLTLAQVAAWMGYREFYFLGIDLGGTYCYAPDTQRFFHPRQVWRIKECFKRAKQDVEAAGGVLMSCTPDSPINEAVGYIPLEEVIGAVLAA